MTTDASTLPRPETAGRPRPKLGRFAPLIVIVLGLVAYAGYTLRESRRPYEWSGTVEARTIDVGSRAGGRVKEVLVHEGDHVEPGQPLVVLEPGDLAAQKLMAEGQLAQAEANLEKLQNGARPEEIAQAKARASTASAALEEARHGARREEIASAEARLASAQAALDKAQLDADRANKLLVSGAISKSEADAADAARKSAIGQRDAQKHALDELVNGVRREQVHQAEARVQEAQASAKLVAAGSRVEDIRAAQGVVDAAKGKLESIQVLLDELTIKSPGPARVEALDLRPGDIVPPNATAASLLEDDQLYVRIYVPETRIGLLHVGDVVPITVDSFPKREFKGQVEHINSVGEYSPRNLQTADQRADQVFAARIGIREGREDLRAGMAALIKVPK